MFNATKSLAVNAPNKFIELEGRKLAYRDIGSGKPIVLCTRFRGNLDTWDPAFLDALVECGLRVITFDYSGLGLSSGEKTYNPFDMAKDPIDLIKALGLSSVVISGWSLGGMVAQVVLAIAPDLISHAVLIGTTPPGQVKRPAEDLFYEYASIPVNSFDDEIILFFEPKSELSKAAARRSHDRIFARKEGNSPAVPIEFAVKTLEGGPSLAPFPAPPILDALKSTTIPILHIGGDHDVVFPVENWYDLNRQLPTLQLLTYPSSGHGPQHQFPETAASYISAFSRPAP